MAQDTRPMIVLLYSSFVVNATVFQVTRLQCCQRMSSREDYLLYLPTGRRPVSFRARSARVPDHRPQAGFLSGAKRPCICPPAAGRFPSGREAPVYLPTGRRPVSFRRPYTCPPAVGRFAFGREAPVYLPTGRRPVACGRAAGAFAALRRS